MLTTLLAAATVLVAVLAAPCPPGAGKHTYFIRWNYYDKAKNETLFGQWQASAGFPKMDYPDGPVYPYPWTSWIYSSPVWGMVDFIAGEYTGVITQNGGKCLDAGENPHNGSPIGIFECLGNVPRQMWHISGGKVKLAGTNVQDGDVQKNLQLWQCYNNNPNQIFTFQMWTDQKSFMLSDVAVDGQ